MSWILSLYTYYISLRSLQCSYNRIFISSPACWKLSAYIKSPCSVSFGHNASTIWYTWDTSVIHVLHKFETITYKMWNVPTSWKYTHFLTYILLLSQLRPSCTHIWYIWDMIWFFYFLRFWDPAILWEMRYAFSYSL